jgi:hypothetical protein
MRVYLAGVVNNDGEMEDWRSETFLKEGDSGSRGRHEEGERGGRFIYAGPTIDAASHGLVDGVHGMNFLEEEERELVQRCLCEVTECEVLFAWIDRTNTVGTVAEIGFAYAASKTIFLAFMTQELARHFYFIQPMAKKVTTSPTAALAWKEFEVWTQSTVRARSLD